MTRVERMQAIVKVDAHGQVQHLGSGGRKFHDIEVDPNETDDLAAQPDKVSELVAQYEAWEKRVGVVPQ
jgi:hypothetical protein